MYWLNLMKWNDRLGIYIRNEFKLKIKKKNCSMQNTSNGMVFFSFDWRRRNMLCACPFNNTNAAIVAQNSVFTHFDIDFRLTIASIEKAMKKKKCG